MAWLRNHGHLKSWGVILIRAWLQRQFNTPFAVYPIILSSLSRIPTDVNTGSFMCFSPARGWLSGWLSRVWQSLLVEGWPDFHDAGLQVYMCRPCGRVVQFGGKAIPVTPTQTVDLLITWLVVVSINTLVARIWDTDQPVCGKLHSSDTNEFNKKINLMHASCC